MGFIGKKLQNLHAVSFESLPGGCRKVKEISVSPRIHLIDTKVILRKISFSGTYSSHKSQCIPYIHYFLYIEIKSIVAI